eukprot:3360858-Amphidinium_carterae.1
MIPISLGWDPQRVPKRCPEKAVVKSHPDESAMVSGYIGVTVIPAKPEGAVFLSGLATREAFLRQGGGRRPQADRKYYASEQISNRMNRVQRRWLFFLMRAAPFFVSKYLIARAAGTACLDHGRP